MDVVDAIGARIAYSVRNGAEMMIGLDCGEIDVLLESLEYSKRAVRDAEDTPYGVRQDKLQALDVVAAKLRAARSAAKASPPG